MQAMVLEKIAPIESSPLVFKKVTLRDIQGDEVLIKVSACGVCHTDLHIVEGELPPHKLPLIPGHQIVGRVVEKGEEAQNLDVGQRVGVPWINQVCGECRFCKQGMENLCENALFTGYDLDGGYAEFAVFKESAVYPLPDGYTDEEFAPLLCGGVIGYRAYRKSGVKGGDLLGLFGFGSSAHLVAQMALFEGVRVFVFTRSPEHQKLAWELGASFVGRAEDAPPEKLDAAIIFAPVGYLVKVALEYLHPGGRVVTAGIYSTPIPEIPYQLIYGERCLQSVANSTRKDVQELIEFAEKLRFRTQIELFPLEEANRALLLLKESKIRASAVLKI